MSWKPRNAVIGKYKILEARSIYDPSPATAQWRVYFQDAMDPLSVHTRRMDAIKAVHRYQADAADYAAQIKKLGKRK